MSDHKNNIVAKMMERFAEFQAAEALARSWFMAEPREKWRRLRAVMALSVELATVKAQTSFGTALGEAAIERIIDGDWKLAAEYAQDFTYEYESPELRERQAPIWAKFVAKLREVCAEA